MGLYVTGVIGVIVFYIAVLAVGIWAAAFKRRQAAQGHMQNDMILANRRLGPLLGVFTLIGKGDSVPEISSTEISEGKK